MKHAIRLYDLKQRCFCDVPDANFVLALGNFDGVHAAHHALLVRAMRLAQKYSESQKAYSAAWMFDPPSSDVLQNKTDHLTMLEEKLSLLARCGLDYAFIADFAALRDLSAQDFIDEILLCHAHAIHVVCGFHFHFGKGGVGNAQMLIRALGSTAVDVIPPIYAFADLGHTVISSTAIRAALSEGRVETAARLLGRPYRITAIVEQGKGLARTLGLPTINQRPAKEKILPMRGVYATLCHMDGKVVAGVTNVGHRPTTDGENEWINLETHLLDVNQDLYGKEISVDFIARLRDEMTFSSIDHLKLAIENDVNTVRRLFKENKSRSVLFFK